MSRYILAPSARLDLKEILRYITRFNLADGIEIVRIVSGYRDLEALFSNNQTEVEE
jgi:hypothetical protein